MLEITASIYMHDNIHLIAYIYIYINKHISSTHFELDKIRQTSNNFRISIIVAYIKNLKYINSHCFNKHATVFIPVPSWSTVT